MQNEIYNNNWKNDVVFLNVYTYIFRFTRCAYSLNFKFKRLYRGNIYLLSSLSIMQFNPPRNNQTSYTLLVNEFSIIAPLFRKFVTFSIKRFQRFDRQITIRIHHSSNAGARDPLLVNPFIPEMSLRTSFSLYPSSLSRRSSLPSRSLFLARSDGILRLYKVIR